MTRIMIIGSSSESSLSAAVARVLSEHEPYAQIEIAKGEDSGLSIVEHQPPADLAHEAERLMSKRALRPADRQARTHPTSPRQRGGW